MTLGLAAQQRIRIVAVIVVGLLIAAPFYWLTITALKSSQEALGRPPTWFPTSIHLDNIDAALQYLSVDTFINSLIFTVSVTALQFICVICTGFALAKMDFPGRRALFIAFVGTLFVPFHVLLIPTFLVVRGLNIIDTWPGLVLPIVAQTTFGTFLFRQFYVSLPNELLEAARIDGANWGQVFLMIVLPLSGPASAAYLSVTILSAWNMYVWPLVGTYSPNLRVLPLALATLGGDNSFIPPNVAMMAVLIATLPILAIFVIAQRWFVSGLTGAIKE